MSFIFSTNTGGGGGGGTWGSITGTLSDQTDLQAALDAKVAGPGTSVDSEIAIYSGTGGQTIKRATGTGVVHATSGVYSASAVVLTSEVSGVLPVANGGTNSSAALNNNRIIQSSGGAVVEATAITATRALVSDANGIPVAATPTTTEVNRLSGVGSQVDGISDARTLTNKSIDADANTITNIENADIKAAAAIAVNKLAAITASRAVVSDGSGFVSAATTTATEIGFVNGVTSAIQTQFAAKVAGPGTSVDSEIAIYSGTGGQTVKRATGTGVVHSTSGVYSVGTVTIAEGGTGQVTQTAAFDALDPLTTKGDLIVNNGSNSVRHAVGSNNTVLTADSAQGDGLKYSQVDLTTSMVTGALPIANGGSGQITATAAFNALDPITTKGDLIVHDGTNSVRQAVGTTNHVLTADSAQTNGIKYAQVSLTASVTGVLPVANGGTNSSAALGGNLVMVSTSTAVTESVNTATNSLVGGVKYTTISISANRTLDTTTKDYHVFCDSSGGVFNVTLPTPTSATGREIVIWDLKGTFETNNVTLVRSASEKINQIAASRVLATNFGCWRVQTNGTDWLVV